MSFRRLCMSVVGFSLEGQHATQTPYLWKATVTDAEGTCAATQRARLMQRLWLQARSGPETTRLCGLCSWEEGQALTSPSALHSDSMLNLTPALQRPATSSHILPNIVLFL